MMQVFLTDGRIVSVPAIWFPLLHEATAVQRQRYVRTDSACLTHGYSKKLPLHALHGRV